MFKQMITSSIVGLSLLVAGPALAHNSHSHHSHDYQVINPVVKPVLRPARHCVKGRKINQRQANQNRQIRRGIRKGQLIGWEITQVKQQQRRIRNAEKRMRNSGRCLTRKEFNRLMKRLDRAGRKIQSLKRNNVRRGHNRNRHNRRHR